MARGQTAKVRLGRDAGATQVTINPGASIRRKTIRATATDRGSEGDAPSNAEAPLGTAGSGGSVGPWTRDEAGCESESNARAASATRQAICPARLQTRA